ncbi:hypothetical protein Unana1_01157 [Umbelopsis nana]
MSEYHTDVEMLEVDLQNKWNDVTADSDEILLRLQTLRPEEESMQVVVSDTYSEEDFDSTLLGVGKEFLAAEESKNSGKKNRGCYKAYTEEQIAEFVNLIRAEEQRQIPETSKEKKKSGRKPKFNEEYTKHLVKFMDERPTAVLEDINQTLGEI